MPRYKSIALTIACLILLQGCKDIPVPQYQANQYKHVAVISTFDDQILMSKYGLALFGNEDRMASVDLGAKNSFSAVAVAALSAKYEVTDLSQYGRQFAEQPKYWPDTKIVIGTETRPSAGEVVKRLVSPATYDAYIIISPGRAIDAGARVLGGIGIHKMPSFIHDDPCVLYAGALVSVIDGKSYDAIAWVESPPNTRAVLIDCHAWEAPDQSVAIIKPALDGLIAKSVPAALKNAQLIQ